MKVSFALISIDLGLRIFSFYPVYRFLNRSHPILKTDGSSAETLIREYIWGVSRMSRFLLGKDSCLRQALAAQYFLCRAGIPVSFKIGVTKNIDGSLLAHAWIENEGAILLGGSDGLLSRFRQLPDLNQAISPKKAGQSH